MTTEVKSGRREASPMRLAGALSHAAPRPSRLSVVIVTYNSASVLPGLLDSLPAGLAGIDDFEIVVVDNASGDGSAALARAHPVGARIIETGRNAGYAAGINAAAATIAPDRDLLILNPDVRLLPGSALPLMERLGDPAVGIAVPRNLTSHGVDDRTLRREPSILSAWAEALLGGKTAARLGLGEMIGDPAVYDREGLVDWATGCALLISARARRLVGEWDESFFLYSEEVDYQRRARAKGLAIAYVPRSVITHIGGDYQTNPRLLALMTANRIRYYRRHHGRAATALFQLGVAAGQAARSWQSAPHRASLLGALAPSRARRALP